jgi:hypothetical protein
MSDWMAKAATRDISILLLSAGMLALIIFAHVSGAFRMPDALFYDAVNLRDSGRSPKVILVRSDAEFNKIGADRYDRLVNMARSRGVKRIAFAFDPGQLALNDRKAADIVIAAAPARIPGSAKWILNKKGNAANIRAAAEYGIYRRQLAWIDGPQGRIAVFESAAAGRSLSSVRDRAYLVRLSQSQNLPEIDASQLVSGAVEQRTLTGLVMVVQDPGQSKIASARGSGADAMTSGQYSAAAIQTLIDRREVTVLPLMIAALLLVVTALVLTWAYLRYDTRRIFVPTLIGGVIITVAACISAIVFASILMPVTSLLVYQLIIAPIILYHGMRAQERRLKRFVTGNINQSVMSNTMKDLPQIQTYLTKMAGVLGMGNMAIMDRYGDVKIAVNAKTNEECAPPLIDKKIWRKVLAQIDSAADGSLDGTLDGSLGNGLNGNAVIPEWEGDIQASKIGSGNTALYWIYTLPHEPMDKGAALTASKAAVSYSRMLSLQDDLNDGPDKNRRYFPLDEWVSNAVKLVGEQSGQIISGIDQLDTAVILFHPFGFPLHANAKMAEVYDLAGIQVTGTTLFDAIAALTGFGKERIDLILKDLLINGGEMRVHCRQFDARVRSLRIGSLNEGDDNPHQTIILEAIDITDLKYLAELNLSVGNLLNLHLCNDLEAVSLASAMAQDPRLSDIQRVRILGQVDKASARAKSRLDDVALRFRDVGNFNMTEAYPVELIKVVGDLKIKTQKMFTELNVELITQMPSVGGYVIAEPRALSSLIEAILQIVGADSLPGEAVQLNIEDEATKSVITISGGVGMAFDQIYRAIDSTALDAPAPFKAFGEGLSNAVRWGTLVTYSSGIGKGYRFNIEMRRVG